MDGMLSQEEINALLSGIGQDTSEESVSEYSGETLTDAEKDAIGEISNISMGTAATTLSTLVNQKVVITTPVVSYSSLGELSGEYDKPCVFIQISYKEGLDGSNILIMKENDVKIITDLMMGGDGSNISEDLTDLHLSAIGEAMNQMMGSSSTSLSSMIEKKVDISPPVASLIDLNDSFEESSFNSLLKGDFVKVAFRMEIGDLIDSTIMQLYPFEFARNLYHSFFNKDKNSSQKNSVPPPTQTPPQQEPRMSTPVQMPNQGMQGGYAVPDMYQQSMGYQNPFGQMGMPGQMNMAPQMPMQDVNVQTAQFQPFSTNVNPLTQQENIGLIMDVPLEVTVELGRTNKSIKEILEFSPGTIIELNKLAGEPIDVLVNGKFVAKGEVVVIEESFGIRVTEIVR